jgi:septal ring factor EnvC (AmiA/AmiB activator)
MSKEQKVIYEPHPVSEERKRELKGKGYKILDAAFKPEFFENDEFDETDALEAIHELNQELTNENIRLKEVAVEKEKLAAELEGQKEQLSNLTQERDALAIKATELEKTVETLNKTISDLESKNKQKPAQDPKNTKAEDQPKE